MSNQQPLYYHLSPIYPGKPGSIATAALVNCIATGRQLHHCGGPGYALSPDVVKALDASQNGGRSRVIVDAEDWDGLRAALGWFIRDIDGTHTEMVAFDANIARAREVLERTKS